MAITPPPPPLKATVQRFYTSGTPTPDQVRFETVLAGWLKLLTQSYLPLSGASLPTTDPHVVGQLWNSAGTVRISAG